MKGDKKYLYLGLFVMTIVALLAGLAVSGGEVTITGTVNDNYQITTDDGTIYEVEEGEKGDEVVELVGKRVKVTGTVVESEDMRLLTVTSYQVIEE